jgi:hypothetical protein
MASIPNAVEQHPGQQEFERIFNDLFNAHPAAQKDLLALIAAVRPTNAGLLIANFVIVDWSGQDLCVTIVCNCATTERSAPKVSVGYHGVVVFSFMIHHAHISFRCLRRWRHHIRGV